MSKNSCNQYTTKTRLAYSSQRTKFVVYCLLPFRFRCRVCFSNVSVSLSFVYFGLAGCFSFAAKNGSRDVAITFGWPTKAMPKCKRAIRKPETKALKSVRLINQHVSHVSGRNKSDKPANKANAMDCLSRKFRQSLLFPRKLHAICHNNNGTSTTIARTARR